jgi:cysteinyl-tRNA synthetase
VREAYGAVAGMCQVLGIWPEDWASTSSTDQLAVIDALVHVALDQRAAARARKDYAAADAVRDQLTAAGVVVEDTPDGSRWSLR